MLKRTTNRVQDLKAALTRFWNDNAGTAALVNFTRPMTTGIFDRRSASKSADRKSRGPKATGVAKSQPNTAPSLSQCPVMLAPFVCAQGNQSSNYQTIKRALDVVGSLVGLVLLSPILLTVLAILTITTRGKPLFSQIRVGQCGRQFRMFKFRTMRLDADKLQHLVKNEKDGPIFKCKVDPRITKIGRWLRKTSIDEMPQLVSVLVGHMSLVGPRPPVPKEVAEYKAWQRRRLAVKPGLTCLWQVSGRSDVGFMDWMRMDIWYVTHQNLWTDLKLLVRTPLTVVLGKGAY